MSGDENKAIKTLKNIKEKRFYTHAFDNGTLVLDDDEIECVETILNLIEKQQKEIEELKKDKKALVKNYDKVLETFISKDKIKEKIKEYEDTYMISDIAEDGLKENYKLVIIVLQELLEK